MDKKTLVDSTAVKQGILSLFEDDDGNILLKSPNHKNQELVMMSNEGELNENLLMLEIFLNTMSSERNLQHIYKIEYANDFSYINFLDNDKPKLRYGTLYFSKVNDQSLKKADIDLHFDNNQYELLNNDEYKGNYFSSILCLDTNKILERPNRMTYFMNLTEKQRAEKGIKSASQCGIYLEKRSISIEEEIPRLTTERRGYVIPEIVKLKEIVDDVHMVKYYSPAFNAAYIPTSSPYPESLKNIRDIIPFIEGDAKKKKLVTAILDTVFGGLEIGKDIKKEDFSVIFDELIVSIYGRIKELFSIKQKTLVISNKINKPDLDNFDDSEIIILSDSLALIDGQNSVDAMSELAKMIDAFLHSLINNESPNDNIYESNSVYKKVVKAINLKYSDKTIGRDQQIKEVKMILDAIHNHLIQVDLKIISAAYEKDMDKIIEAKNLAISIAGSDNKLFDQQQILPVLQNEIFNSKKCEGLYLTYAKAQTPKYNEDSEYFMGINLSEVIAPYISHLSLKKKSKDIQVIRNTFKGKEFSKKDSEILNSLVDQFKDTPKYKEEKERIEREAMEKQKEIIDFSSSQDVDEDFDIALELAKNQDLTRKRILNLENRELVINKENFKRFEDFLLKFAISKEVYQKNLQKILACIDIKIQNKKLFSIFLASCFYKEKLGVENVDAIIWAKSLNKAINKNGGNITTIRNNLITDDEFFVDLLESLDL